MRNRLCVILLASAIHFAAWLLAGCGGTSTADSLAVEGSAIGVLEQSSLPLPSTLGRSTSAAETSVDGGSFEPGWPVQQVSPAGSSAQFTPVAPGEGINDAAFALYRLATPSAQDYYQLQLQWGNVADASNLWLALADFDADAWRMFPMTGSSVLPFSANAYVQGGEVWAAVLCFDETPWQLDTLSLLDAQAPDDIPIDFTLQLIDSEETITLSDYRAESPVVLFIGSYT